ncbi:MAG: cation diffusion facilitator family transporter, partial [Anaerolineae bacterium]
MNVLPSSKFPSSIPLPDAVAKIREQRRREMTRTASRGLFVRVGIILAELAGFAMFNSSALLLDALSTLIDVASSLFLIVCIKIADKPPDDEHPFGHGRFEPIAGLQLGLFLSAIGIVMLFQQFSSLLKGSSNKGLDPHTWIIPVGAVIVLEICYRQIKRMAKKQHSPALYADAVHYRIDSINSCFAAIALALAAYFPSYSVILDHLGAMMIACLMIGIGGFAAYKNLHQLLDRIPAPQYFENVRAAAQSVPGVLATEKLRIQSYGPDAHISIDVEVDPLLSVEIAHEITQKVRAEIQKVWPSVRDVIVHVEPYYA